MGPGIVANNVTGNTVTVRENVWGCRVGKNNNKGNNNQQTQRNQWYGSKATTPGGAKHPTVTAQSGVGQFSNLWAIKCGVGTPGWGTIKVTVQQL